MHATHSCSTATVPTVLLSLLPSPLFTSLSLFPSLSLFACFFDFDLTYLLVLSLTPTVLAVCELNFAHKRTCTRTNTRTHPHTHTRLRCPALFRWRCCCRRRRRRQRLQSVVLDLRNLCSICLSASFHFLPLFLFAKYFKSHSVRETARMRERARGRESTEYISCAECC